MVAGHEEEIGGDTQSVDGIEGDRGRDEEAGERVHRAGKDSDNGHGEDVIEGMHPIDGKWGQDLGRVMNFVKLPQEGEAMHPVVRNEGSEISEERDDDRKDDRRPEWRDGCEDRWSGYGPERRIEVTRDEES